METFLEQVFNGVSQGSILLLIALGLTFTFGQMGVINMAHGELIMTGAYTPYVLQTEVGLFAGATSTAFMLSLPVAFVAAGLVGVLMERLLLRRMYDRPLDTLLVTFGVRLLLQQAAKSYFGAAERERHRPVVADGNVEIARRDHAAHPPVHHRPRRRDAGRSSRWSWPGRRRAGGCGPSRRTATSPRSAAWPTGRVDRLTFFLGSGLAGIAGVAVALIGADRLPDRAPATSSTPSSS